MSWQAPVGRRRRPVSGLSPGLVRRSPVHALGGRQACGVSRCPGVRGEAGLGAPRAGAFAGESIVAGASACGFGSCPALAGGCTCLYAGSAAWERRRVYIWCTARRARALPAPFAQVRELMKVQAGAGCKTVGSAYVGSNPTPATTSENGPLAAENAVRRAVFFLSRRV